MGNVNNHSCTLLKLERIKQKKGQKEVCYGICVPSYLSKIEHNQVTPDSAIIKQLFQRLGIEFYCEDDFIHRNQALINQYYDQLTYGIDRTAYPELQKSDKELTYSPLAIDWLLIKVFEDDKEAFTYLSECRDNMNDRQLAYFNILQSTEYGEEDNSINLSRKAFSILNNSYSLLNLMHTYWLKGQYDKVHECADKCIALALDEGNTWNLASCYRLIGSVYACLNAEEIMIPFYNRAIHLLQNTYWNNQLDDIYYNIGATYISNKNLIWHLGIWRWLNGRIISF